LCRGTVTRFEFPPLLMHKRCPEHCKTMSKEDIVIPTIFLGSVILTSVIPIVQVMLMTLSGGLTQIISIPFYNDKPETLETIGIVFNAALTALGLFFFYKSKETSTRILTSLLVLFFGQGMMLFTIDHVLKEDDSYYIYWTVLSGTPMFLTLLVGLFKYWTLNLKQVTKT
jgi:hypothetical protein